MNRPSLRSRLLKILVVPIIGGILLVGAASCISTYHEAAEVYDAEQVHFAKVLQMLTRQINDSAVISINGIPRDDAYEKYMAFRVWKGSDVFLQSNNSRDFGPRTQTEGFSNREIDGLQWRFYMERRGGITVEVAEEDEVRLDLVRHILAGIFLPQLIIIPIIAIIIWFGITRGLKPVERLSQLVRTRNINELTPLCDTHVPRELVPMVDAINDLMRRIADAIRIEKNFTTYAAHEMRTPIAALKTQAQVILRTKEPEKQKELASALLATVSRTQRIIEQLLTYARVQHDVVALAPTHLSEIVRDEIRHSIPRAMEKRIEIESDIDDAIIVNAQEPLLRLMIANIIDNAVKYIHESDRIHVALTHGKDGVILSIRDNGPGIDSSVLPHIFDPFYRIAGNQASGVGLGLAIVKWACDVQHIRIQPGDGLDGRGIGFMLHFPSASVA